MEFRRSQLGDLDQIVRNGEVNDDEYGTVPSLSLNPAKARVLLTLCLMKGMNHAAITEAFETH